MIFRLSAWLKLCHKKRGFRRSLVPAVGHIGLPTLLVIIINWVVGIVLIVAKIQKVCL